MVHRSAASKGLSVALEVVLVADEPSIRLSVGDAIRAAGHRVRLAADGVEGAAAIAKERTDVVISDVRMPKMDGLTLFRQVRRDHPDVDMILITTYGEVKDAVGALKDGASDYLTKPFEIEELLLRLERIDKERALHRELATAREQLARAGKSSIIGSSASMAQLMDRIETFAPSDAAVLVLGESGTGKELVARTLHERSPRAAKPFVAVNCAAFPETLIEAELFGHERGAFTGAVKKRDGRFKAAHGGTLFLDEVAEIPLPTQAKLLRVLQDGVIEPLGTNQSIAVNVRIVSATHRNLKDRIAQGTFREDLFYRLNVLSIAIPPMRERRSDLPILVEHFLKKFAPPGRAPAISPRAWAAISEYPFPGNVRELEHAVQHAVILSKGEEIEPHHLPSSLAGQTVPVTVAPGAETKSSIRVLSDAIKEFEHEYLVRALRVTGGRKAEAAGLLGISRKNLWEKMKGHGVDDSEVEPAEGA